MPRTLNLSVDGMEEMERQTKRDQTLALNDDGEDGTYEDPGSDDLPPVRSVFALSLYVSLSLSLTVFNLYSYLE